MKAEYKFVEMAEIDHLFMLHIKQLREGKFTQTELSEAMAYRKAS